MKRKIADTDKPIGPLKVIKDFLPPPEKLILKGNGMKLTRFEKEIKDAVDQGKFKTLKLSKAEREKYREAARATLAKDSNGSNQKVKALSVKMRKEYDFSKAVKNPFVAGSKKQNKVRIDMQRIKESRNREDESRITEFEMRKIRENQRLMDRLKKGQDSAKKGKGRFLESQTG